MSTQSPSRVVVYPDDDGLPMSDNMQQYEWIVKIAGSLMALFRDKPDVLVAGNLLWYPIEGDNRTRTAPDAMVVFGRPRNEYRGSYKQWREGGVAPQVVFEVLSPGNRPGEMAEKLAFYDRFDVEEYYIINPDPCWVEGWRRVDGVLTRIPEMNGWISPRLGVRFEPVEDQLILTGPDGLAFETYPELAQRADEADRRAEEERERAEEAHQKAEEAHLRAEEQHLRAEEEYLRAEEEHQRAEEAHRKAERLREKLRALGIDPDA